MLWGSDKTFMSEALGRLEPVWPRGFKPRIESYLPSVEVMKGTVLDPGVGASMLDTVLPESCWTAGIVAQRLEGLQGVMAGITQNVGVLAEISAEVAASFDPAAMMRLIQAANGSGEMYRSSQNIATDIGIEYAFSVADAIGTLVGPFKVLVDAGTMAGKNARNQALAAMAERASAALPFAKDDTDTDVYQANIAVGVAGSRDTTRLYMPRTIGEWTLERRKEREVYGWAMGRGEPGKIEGAAGLGCDPGSATVDSLLQVQFPFQYVEGLGHADKVWTRVLCNYRNRSCGQSRTGFDGGKDCRQCVDPYIFAHRNTAHSLEHHNHRPNAWFVQYATVGGVGDTAWQVVATPSPSTFTVGAVRLLETLGSHNEGRIEALRRWWKARHGRAFRLALVQLASRLISEKARPILGYPVDMDGQPLYALGGWEQVPGDASTLDLGTIDAAFATIGLNLEDDTKWAREVKPSLKRVLSIQMDAIRYTDASAYVDDRYGAFTTDKEMRDMLGTAFAEILDSRTRRDAVSYADVIDEGKRAALVARGVQALAIRMPRRGLAAGDVAAGGLMGQFVATKPLSVPRAQTQGPVQLVAPSLYNGAADASKWWAGAGVMGAIAVTATAALLRR